MICSIAAADHHIILGHHEIFWATMKVAFYDQYLAHDRE